MNRILIQTHQVTFTFLTSVLLLFFLSACSNGTESSGSQSVDKQANSETNSDLTINKQANKIALVMKTLTNPFFIEMERGARRAEKDLSIKLIVKTAAQETSIQQQIGIVETLIQDKVDAIVIAPGDSIELIPVLKLAQDSGIVVINIDNQLDPDFSDKSGLTRVPFISVDNEKAAYESTKVLTENMNTPTKVAILEGIPGAKNAEDRKNGAVKAFAEQPLAMLVAMQSAHWKIDEGMEVTRRILLDHPDLGAMFCANDMMALGAIQYLQSVKNNVVKVASYDALEPAVDAVKAGTLMATIDQQAAEQGYQGVLYAQRALSGEKLPEITLIATRLITRETVQKIRP